ncbi:hypothetical protein D3C78_1922820 [compost metagenome]
MGLRLDEYYHLQTQDLDRNNQLFLWYSSSNSYRHDYLLSLLLDIEQYWFRQTAQQHSRILI